MTNNFSPFSREKVEERMSITTMMTCKKLRRKNVEYILGFHHLMDYL